MHLHCGDESVLQPNRVDYTAFAGRGRADTTFDDLRDAKKQNAQPLLTCLVDEWPRKTLVNTDS